LWTEESVVDVLDKLAPEEDNAEKPRVETTETEEEAADDSERIKSRSVLGGGGRKHGFKTSTWSWKVKVG
jgi:hypothetical protein